MFFEMVGATGVEPVQTYLYAGGLQPLELTNAQHTHVLERVPGFEPGPTAWKAVSSPRRIPARFQLLAYVLSVGDWTARIVGYRRIFTSKRASAVSYLWWRMSGSNRRPIACKAIALPAELIPQEFIGAGCRIRTDDLSLTRRLLYQLS